MSPLESVAVGWQFLVDRGGTFTDVVARGPQGEVVAHKLLSLGASGADATLQVLAQAPGPVDDLRLGTTVATNALLERRGEEVTLITTRGFADLLEIGNQERPDIFALQIEKRALLQAAVVEVDERIRADGTIERAPSRAELTRALTGHRAVAVLFVNAGAHPAHERLAGEVARELGIEHVTLSHEVSPEIGMVGRGDTTVADAYLTPLLRRFVDRMAAPGRRTLFMQSSGGLTDAAHFSGRHAVLSGPAGGVVAVAHAARRAGLSQVIGFDMGGTSTDVSRCAGEPERTYESVTAGVRIRAPMLHVVTVAAGGGSILARRDGRDQVGPTSAGADPGPACYGRGGPATVTDANLVAGRILPEWFPHLSLDTDAARAALAAFGDPDDTAAGFLRIADENMAAAIRQISTARGYDLRDHALCAFGGAAGQHACALADLLQMPEVLVPPHAGVFSASGMGLADVTHDAVVPVLAAAAARGAAEPDFPDAQARAALQAQGLTDVEVRRSIDVRYVGVDETINVPWSADWLDDFIARHQALYGFLKPGHPVEIVNARAHARHRAAPATDPERDQHAHEPEPVARDVGPLGAAVHRRDDLLPGARVRGPAVIVEDHATTVVDAGWFARVDGHLALRLTRDAAPAAARTRTTIGLDRDPVSLEIMGNRFMGIAERMGEQLRRVAHSTNIKERLDFSCALFDARGRLVANAPHIPVHIGAMGETVASLIRNQVMRPGDTWISNDPFKGGSHLPDLTVVTPVYRDGELAFFVANRGHHADVGGSTPGSMPPHSRRIDEEGLLLSEVLLVADGALREDDLVTRMRAAGVRDIDERLSDLRSQVACNQAGTTLLGELCDELGLDVVTAWMGHVENHAAEVMADVVSGLSDGAFEDHLDDGTRIRVAITLRGGRAVIDFTGTAPQHPGNRNAPRAVTVAAVLYVFRTLAERAIPLNAGCLRPLDIVIPPGSLLDPVSPAAVVGGNVETAQRIVDVLYGALGKLAASQGTMNNVTFGDETFGYYETICGGAGAGHGFHGASAVHTHMTNTRITDPEVLEQRYPVVLREFSIRRGSGGKGTWNGGDGVVRRIEFLRPLQCTVLAERRVTEPFGLNAGPGARGEHEITTQGVVVKTPGGGGFTPETLSITVPEPDNPC